MLRCLPLLFVLLTGCAAPRPAAPAADSAPALVSAPATASAALKSGPMLGYATHREVAVWMQTTRPADVQLRYRPEGAGLDQAQTTPAVRADAETDHIARFAVADLEPGTRYTYDVLIDGQTFAGRRALAFETQPLWQWRTDPPDFTAAIGSCAYVNDPPYDRPGTPYGGDHRIFETIAAAEPDLMLWLGDNTYLREVDWWSEGGMRYRYAHDRALPELQNLLAATNHYATWDDHDFGPNNSDRSYVLGPAAREVFQDYWANVSYGLPDVPGIFGHFQWADVDFFLLDDRTHRTPLGQPAGAERQILGEAQLTWLLEALTTSQAPFKIVALGSQVLNPMEVYETYSNTAPAERDRLIAGLVERRIEGVVFLSGDRHHTEVIRVQPDGFYPLYDFTSSPLTAGAATPRQEMDNPARVPNTLVAGQRNFGTLTVTGPRTDRVLTMRTFDTDGALLWEYAIPASELQLPQRGR